MFEGLSDYLTDFSRSYHQDEMDISGHTVSNTRDSALEEDNSSSFEKNVSLYNQDGSSFHQQRHPEVELVSLFIVLSGLVREKSQFTQYINYGYTLSTNSKPVFLQISSSHTA